MPTLTKLVDPAGAHLKRTATQMGSSLISNKIVGQNKIHDGFLVKGTADGDQAIVTVMSAPWVLVSPLPDIYSGVGLVREVRLPHPLARWALDQSGQVNPPSLTAVQDQVKVYPNGTAVYMGNPLQSVTVGAWSTADPVPTDAGVVLLAPFVRSSTAGGRLIDFVLYRSTAARSLNSQTDGQGVVTYQNSGPVTPGSVAYVLFSSTVFGVSPGSPSVPNLMGSPVACEFEPGDGAVGFFSFISPDTNRAHFARYLINPGNSQVTLAWHNTVDEFTPSSMYSVGDAVRCLGLGETQWLLLSLDRTAGYLGSSALVDADVATFSNPLPFTKDDAPWFLAPRKTFDTALGPSLQYWTAVTDLDAVLITPGGGLVTLSTPGYYVQRGCNRQQRSGTANDGELAPVGTEVEGRRAYYGIQVFPEFSVANACAYAPGVMAVVVCPEGQYQDDTQDRCVALIDVETGGMLSVSPPVANGDIWYGVSVSCFELGARDETGEITRPGALIVSSWRPYVPELDDAPPPVAKLGAWVTLDGGATLTDLYRPTVYNAVAPIAKLTYMGNAFLPAKMGETRNQWLTHPTIATP